MASTGPILGKLYEPLLASLQQGEHTLSYLNDCFADPADWKRTAAQFLRDRLLLPHRTVSPTTQPRRGNRRLGYREETIEFEDQFGGAIPATVLIPDFEGPYPAVIVMHEHGGTFRWGAERLLESEGDPDLVAYRNRAYGGRSFAGDLARVGFLALIADAYGFGSRSPFPGHRADDADRIEPLVARALTTSGTTWAGVLAADDLATLDYLRTRPDVDSSRIGCAGMSMGGWRASLLSALTDSLKCTVCAGWTFAAAYQLHHHISAVPGFQSIVPGLLPALDYPNISSLAMPSALLATVGARDPLFHKEGVVEACDVISASYEKAGIAERLCISRSNAAHTFTPHMQDEAIAWLQRWLHPNH